MKRARGGFLTIALFAVAGTLLAFSVVGSSRAALNYSSAVFEAEVRVQEIGVSLVENGTPVSSRNYTGSNDDWSSSNGALLQNLLVTEEGKTEELKLGHKYREELAVQNSGVEDPIEEYVRVTLYKYWEKKNEATGFYEKAPELDSGLIDLHLTLGNGWREDTASRTEERTVLYYDPILDPGDITPAFSDTLEILDEGIEAEVTKTVTQTGEGTVIETVYTYDGARFVIRADVDAVQTHNATDAKMSAWGTVG